MIETTTCPRCGEPERSRTDDSVTYVCDSYQFDGFAISHSEQCDATRLRATNRELLHLLADAKDDIASLQHRAKFAESLVKSATHLFRATGKRCGISANWAPTRDRWLSTARGVYDKLS